MDGKVKADIGSNINIEDVTVPFPEGDDKLLLDKTITDLLEDDKLPILNDFVLPTGNNRLLLDKTIADLTELNRLKVKLDSTDVVDVSDLATEATLEEIKDELKPLTVKESFDETGLDEDVYEATEAYTRSVFGFTIINNNKEEELTFTIGGVAIPVPASTSLYDEFDLPDPLEVIVEGDDLDFDAYLKG